MNIALAQLNPTVGDLDGNLEKIRFSLEESQRAGADLLLFPELFLTGYPPRDLLEREAFINNCEESLEKLKRISATRPQTAILVGGISRAHHQSGKRLHNCAFFLAAGELLFVQAKSLLPAYDVFDETRYFEPADKVRTFSWRDEIIGISICEDAWNEADGDHQPLYDRNPLLQLRQAGATLLINLSASPYYLGKDELRAELLCRQCRRLKLPLLMVNQIGGNDELIFDGGSLAITPSGEIWEQAPQFIEKIIYVNSCELKTCPAPKLGRKCREDELDRLENALVLGISDYFRKCGFNRAVIGLSGGIDSALTCALAVKALGAGHVRGITMPSPYSSPGSVADSLHLAENLGIAFDVLPIDTIFQGYRSSLENIFAGTSEGLAEENLQARIRGNLLMAVANKFNLLLLATGNKSELAVGYCTLYGDMCGGLAPISDLPKGMVYKLAFHLNRNREIIPAATLDKEPSAELRPDQKDLDSLPPYDLLDQVLELYIDEGLDEMEIRHRTGFATDTIERIITLIKRNEYKRRQASPGLKVTGKAFGCGRRMPIAARF
ncbi:MAG TPA: NAD+ synthase [Proteobacteria bacterium]|mgnify:CR=1 FL=1|nr:NAD+ synthase [Pseudomonadota bacterium]